MMTMMMTMMLLSLYTLKIVRSGSSGVCHWSLSAMETTPENPSWVPFSCGHHWLLRSQISPSIRRNHGKMNKTSKRSQVLQCQIHFSTLLYLRNGRNISWPWVIATCRTWLACELLKPVLTVWGSWSQPWMMLRQVPIGGTCGPQCSTTCATQPVTVTRCEKAKH